FWRVRVGIDNRGRKITQSEQSLEATVPMSDFSGADYVLGRFGKEENEILDGVLGRVVKEIKEKICI
ncbi:aminoacyl-tRNA hydrolase, partial [Patescibacteria group bacterium]|nr:aminoacyl-tRNA hydrolase [Patescibacteria group bacterium]